MKKDDDEIENEVVKPAKEEPTDADDFFADM